jgi:hypothetical protein
MDNGALGMWWNLIVNNNFCACDYNGLLLLLVVVVVVLVVVLVEW